MNFCVRAAGRRVRARARVVERRAGRCGPRSSALARSAQYRNTIFFYKVHVTLFRQLFILFRRHFQGLGGLLGEAMDAATRSGICLLTTEILHFLRHFDDRRLHTLSEGEFDVQIECAGAR